MQVLIAATRECGSMYFTHKLTPGVYNDTSEAAPISLLQTQARAASKETEDDFGSWVHV